jgi:selenocysteine-specific elongation factor
MQMEQRIRTIGTAGHVDHGKSALVKALTGIDPDRLKEEKEREMTIDLGFAWLTLPSGAVVSIVDVPGHESFIKNMLAGIGGIDAVLLVVAADEGIMPQTREHLDILDLLDVEHGVVAITKSDLAEDEEWLELVIEDVRELLKKTKLSGAEILPVSAVTGQGLPQLLSSLDAFLDRVPAKRDLGKPRLPVDRVFVMPGFGTVVTGTLVDGALQVGQEVEILPSGARARIRGLQTHKQKLNSTGPGGRVAVNLGGVSSEDVARGDVLAVPGQLKSSSLIDARVRLLASAPRPLKHNVRVQFYSGSSEIQAHVRLLDDETIQPGQDGWVQFRLANRAALMRGDHFIIRQPSPSLTIGGGVVIDPVPRRRHRRFRAPTIQRLEALSLGSPEDILLQGLGGGRARQIGELVAESGLPGDEAREALGQLLNNGEVLLLGADGSTRGGAEVLAQDGYVMSAAGYDELWKRVRGILDEYHGRYPLRSGMPREELKSRVNLPPKVFNALLAQASAQHRLTEEGAAVRLPEYQVKFSAEQQERIDQLLAGFAESPYATPSVSECEETLGPELLSFLVEDGRLVRVSESVIFSRETYDEMVELVLSHIRDQGSITVAEVRDLFRASRKYALALMEHLDEQRITKRVGDERVLR